MQTANTEPNQSVPDSLTAFIVRAVKAFSSGPDEKYFFILNGGLMTLPN